MGSWFTITKKLMGSESGGIFFPKKHNVLFNVLKFLSNTEVKRSKFWLLCICKRQKQISGCAEALLGGSESETGQKPAETQRSTGISQRSVVLTAEVYQNPSANNGYVV